MTKVKVFKILFDKLDGVFFPSEVLKGKVILQLSEPLKMREIRIKFHGFAVVKWKEHHGSGNNRRTDTYKSQEDYFHLAQPLYNARIADLHNESEVVMPEGNHVYNFSYTLPPNIPTSFEGEKGHIRYYTSCTIDLAWKFDEKCKRMFTVICPYDLNCIPQLSNGSHQENETTMGCCCCEEGPIVAQVSIPKQGFVPGEVIPVKVRVNNKASTAAMDRIYVRLDQHIEFHAKCTGLIWDSEKTKYRTRELTNKVSLGTVAASSDTTLSDTGVRVPPCIASELKYCNSINVYYTLKVKVDPAGLEFIFRLVIGTVPLWSQTQYGVVMPEPGVVPSAPLPDIPPPYPHPPPDAPPPSYESCVFGRVNADDDSDNEDGSAGYYAPQYPCFTYLNQPTAPLPPLNQ